MKKYFLFVLTLLACFALVGCGGGDANGGEEKKKNTPFVFCGDTPFEKSHNPVFFGKKTPHKSF